MNPLDAREAEETYEYPARPYTLPMRPVQTFRVLSESGDNVATDPYPEYSDDELDIFFPAAQTTEIEEDDPWEGANRTSVFAGPDPWSDKYLTAEDARVLRQDGI